jgi:hypothetical protein
MRAVPALPDQQWQQRHLQEHWTQLNCPHRLLCPFQLVFSTLCSQWADSGQAISHEWACKKVACWCCLGHCPERLLSSECWLLCTAQQSLRVRSSSTHFRTWATHLIHALLPHLRRIRVVLHDALESLSKHELSCRVLVGAVSLRQCEGHDAVSVPLLSLTMSGRVSAVRNGNGQATHLAKLLAVLVKRVRHVDAVPRRRWTTKANRRSGREEHQSKTNHVGDSLPHSCDVQKTGEFFELGNVFFRLFSDKNVETLLLLAWLGV